MRHLDSEITPADERRFWSKVAVKAPSECWLWTGWDASNYGRSYLKGKRVKAHRFAFGIANGKRLPDGDIVVRHTCDNPGCCNPHHLVPGTQADNIADRDSRRRHWAHGMTHCQRGHPLDGRQSNGRRLCLTCEAARAAKKEARRRERQASLREGDDRVVHAGTREALIREIDFWHEEHGR